MKVAPSACGVVLAGLWVAGGLCVAQEAPGGDPAKRWYARVNTAEAGVRCFATERSPVYRDLLVEGDVVMVGPVTGPDGYRPVYLPLGPTGFVHSDYVESPVEGMVVSKANKLSFRYRPRTREAPVVMVEKGARFHLMAQAGEWLELRYAAAPAFLPPDAIEVFDGGDEVETLDKGVADLDKRRRGEWRDAVAAREKVAAAAVVLRDQLAALDTLRKGFAAVRAKPVVERDFSDLRRELVGFVAALDAAAVPGDAEPRVGVQGLLGLVGQAETEVAAAKLVAEQPRPARLPELPRPAEPGPLAGYDGKGWLRLRGGRVILEKGGQTLVELACRSGLYDLSIFEDLEVGVRGARQRARVDSLRNLEVEHLVVLTPLKR